MNERRPRVSKIGHLWVWRCHHGIPFGEDHGTHADAVAAALQHFAEKHVTPSTGG